jgi:4-hydroxybenzoate polyprenyltransferase
MLPAASGLRYARALLILGRVSNLPTVWSNCLAAWILGGGGPPARFFLLCAGTTCLYLGGMFLNDAFDADFDRQHRRERPIPSGAISLGAVWLWCLVWLATGALLLMSLGGGSGVLAIALTLCILAYDAVHKLVAFSPVLMAACRFFLYLVAASAAQRGLTGLALWSAFAIAFYIIGLSYLARHESTRTAFANWPLPCLGAPLLLALLVNNGDHRVRGLVLVGVVALWVAFCLRPAFDRVAPNPGRAVSGLLAGIVLVDWLAVGGGGWAISLVFVALFGAALVAQRFVPAT